MALCTSHRRAVLLALLIQYSFAQHFAGNFLFPQQGTHFTFHSVDSVNVTWNSHFHHDTQQTVLVLFSNDTAAPFVNQTVSSDGSEIISLNFNGQTVNNGTFSVEDGGSSGESFSSGTFDVVIDDSVSPTTWALGAIPTATVTSVAEAAAAAATTDSDHDSHHGDFPDSFSDSSPPPSGLSPTIIALVVLLSVAFLFVGLLLFRFIRTRRRIRASLPLRKDSGGSFGSPAASFIAPADSHHLSRSRSHSSPWPSPPPPPLSKQQRILGVNVGETVPQRAASRRWFGHALRHSNADPVSAFGIGRGIPSPASVACPGYGERSLALRPAEGPCGLDSTTGSRAAMSILEEYEEDDGDTYGEAYSKDYNKDYSEDYAQARNQAHDDQVIQDSSPQSTLPELPVVGFFGPNTPVELPAREKARNTIASLARDSEVTLPQTAFVPPPLVTKAPRDLSSINRPLTKRASSRSGSKELRVDTARSALPSGISELAEPSPRKGGALSVEAEGLPMKSPYKSPGFRATAMTALRGSGMTVPFALVSPKMWRRARPAAEGEPF